MNNNTKLKTLPYVSLAFAATGTVILNFILPSYPNIFIWMEFIYLTYNINQRYLQGLYINNVNETVEHYKKEKEEAESAGPEEIKAKFIALCDKRINEAPTLITSFLGERRNFTMFAIFTIYGILNSTGLIKWLLSFIGW